MIENIRKEIFTAVIANGSVHQKENWKKLCDEAFEWVISIGHSEQSVPVKKTKRKADTA